MSAKITSINVHVYAGVSRPVWQMDIKVNGETLEHERCDRDYANAGDAITSSRHVVKELVKKGSK